MIKAIAKFFDVLEDHVRATLSHVPILYATITGVGIVLLWRGLWMLADTVPYLTGPVSVAAGIVILLICGVYVSSLLGSGTILSSIKKEEKIATKTEREVEKDIAIDSASFNELRESLHRIEAEVLASKR